MTANEFIANFTPTDLPPSDPNGPWRDFADFDPPFLRSELNKMAMAGVIELDFEKQQFRLLPKALKFVKP